jgi:hypothetical protein
MEGRERNSCNKLTIHPQQNDKRLLTAAPTYPEWEFIRGYCTIEGSDWIEINVAPGHRSRDLGTTFGTQGNSSRDG